MRILKIGTQGDDVREWQTFLRFFNDKSCVNVTGSFDKITEEETKNFQKKYSLKNDGIVGPATISASVKLSAELNKEANKANWPEKPSTGSITHASRVQLFGSFSYVPSPTQSNPEGIKITDGWVKNNITEVVIPQLKLVKGAPKDYKILLHKNISSQTIKLFDTWEKNCLMNNVLTWGGCWVPRFIRGSQTILSNHSWGTAFDINAQWNMLGTVPALKGSQGSVRELVEIAYDHGFYWGGWFPNRLDGMHFEAYAVI